MPQARNDSSRRDLDSTNEAGDSEKKHERPKRKFPTFPDLMGDLTCILASPSPVLRSHRHLHRAAPLALIFPSFRAFSALLLRPFLHPPPPLQLSQATCLRYSYIRPGSSSPCSTLNSPPAPSHPRSFSPSQSPSIGQRGLNRAKLLLVRPVSRDAICDPGVTSPTR